MTSQGKVRQDTVYSTFHTMEMQSALLRPNPEREGNKYVKVQNI